MGPVGGYNTMSYRYGFGGWFDGGGLEDLFSLPAEEEDDADWAGGLEGEGLRPPRFPKKLDEEGLGDALVDGGAFGWSSGIGILLR